MFVVANYIVGRGDNYYQYYNLSTYRYTNPSNIRIFDILISNKKKVTDGKCNIELCHKQDRGLNLFTSL